MLLVHLLWDEEWRPPIASLVRDPSLEKIVVQWAAFCMQQLLIKSAELRMQGKAMEEEITAKLVSRCRIGQSNGAEAERIDLELEELKNKRDNECTWTAVHELGIQENNILRRCMILLSTINHLGAPERLLQVNAPHVAACCIDLPDEDANGGAVVFISNLIAQIPDRNLPPSTFPDPEFVLASLFDNCESATEQNTHDQRSFFTMRLLATFFSDASWRPFFSNMAERDEVARLYVEQILPACAEDI